MATTSGAGRSSRSGARPGGHAFSMSGFGHGTTTMASGSLTGQFGGAGATRDQPDDGHQLTGSPISLEAADPGTTTLGASEHEQPSGAHCSAVEVSRPTPIVLVGPRRPRAAISFGPGHRASP